jgi:hypothetical protein
MHGYDPRDAGRVPAPTSPLPLAPTTRTRVIVEGDSFPARLLLQLLEERLFGEDDEEEDVDEGEDEDDFDDDEEEEEDEGS